MERSFLLITSDESLAGLLKNLEQWGYLPEWRKNGRARSGLKDLGVARKPVLLDLAADGALESLSLLKAYHPEASIIAVSNGNMNITAQSLKFGLSSLVTERDSEAELFEALKRAFSDISRREELESLRSSAEQKIIAKSPAMKKAAKAAREAAEGKEPVMVLGEPGSGRELMARHMHLLSAAAGAPFVKAATDNELPAAIEAARGGTLFIKDISTLTSQAVEVLRAVAKEGDKIKAHLRLMAGLSSLPSPEGAVPLSPPLSPSKKISVPPLRERKEDIIPLAECFIEELSFHLKKRKKYFTKKAKEALLGMEFKEGNAGELKDLVHKAYFLSKGTGIGEKDILGSEYLGKNSFKNFIDERLRGYLKKISELEHSNLYDSVITEVERALIELALRETKGNKLRAARALGMNRNTFRAKIKQLKIKDKFSA